MERLEPAVTTYPVCVGQRLYSEVIIIVRKLMGWVRNVVLMNVYLDPENPGGSGFWVGGYMSQVREWGS